MHTQAWPLEAQAKQALQVHYECNFQNKDILSYTNGQVFNILQYVSSK